MPHIFHVEHTDKQLLELIAASDVPAFNKLYSRYWKLLFLLVRKKTDHTEDASDIVQELFIELWDKRKQLNITHELRPYLISIAYHKTFVYFRKKGVQEKHSKNFEKYLEQAGYSHIEIIQATEELEKEYGKLQDIIDASIELMPARMQEIFLMNLKGHQSIDDIAAHLNISRNTVKSHLQVAMQRLRKVAEEHALDIPLLLIYLSLHNK